MIMQGSEGTVSADDAPAQAITTIGSVLTGSVVGARNLGERLGHKNIITSDIGGTTFLVGMVVDGQPVFDNSTTLNQLTISTPMMKVTSIGSGGGAVAWTPPGRNLLVGPRSAGARPGPACFAQGGTEPTVTDANLILGILDSDAFAGGTKALDVGLARAAIREHIAEPLGLDVEQAAAAIFAIQNAQTADLVRSAVVGQGHDPRDLSSPKRSPAVPTPPTSSAASSRTSSRSTTPTQPKPTTSTRSRTRSPATASTPSPT